ncbi:MAG: hypothetical protein V8R08_03935 [Coriobacteriales bacterium]
MNLASWIILIIVALWAIIAIKVAFFGGFGKKRSCHNSCTNPKLPSDEELKLPNACMGCSKGSCVGCASAAGKHDIPTATIRESCEQKQPL